MRATSGIEQILEARAGVETRKDQVQQVRGVHAGSRTAGPSRGSFIESFERFTTCLIYSDTVMFTLITLSTPVKIQ